MKTDKKMGIVVVVFTVSFFGMLQRFGKWRARTAATWPVPRRLRRLRRPRAAIGSARWPWTLR